MAELVLHFAADHPSGAGHFPGNPIVPGALLLNEVLACIADNLSIINCTWQVKSAKFAQPVRPGDSVRISYTLTANGDIRFECTISDRKVLSGIACGRAQVTGGLPL